MNVDQLARDTANTALAEIKKHDAVCAEKAKADEIWKDDTSRTLENISKSIGRLYGRLWMGAFAVIGTLLGAIGWLITQLIALSHGGL